eukprot:scaffold163745_cov20-Tisochrysis_lutea.AAC.2
MQHHENSNETENHVAWSSMRLGVAAHMQGDMQHHANLFVWDWAFPRASHPLVRISTLGLSFVSDVHADSLHWLWVVPDVS